MIPAEDFWMPQDLRVTPSGAQKWLAVGNVVILDLGNFTSVEQGAVSTCRNEPARTGFANARGGKCELPADALGGMAPAWYLAITWIQGFLASARHSLSLISATRKMPGLWRQMAKR